MLAIRKRRSDRPGKDQDRASKDSTPRPEAGGSSSGFARRGRDAAARADLERRLRASEETLHGLIEASNQGLLIVTREHEPLLANRACAEIFGFDSAEAITALDSTAGLFPPLGLARLEAIDKENLNGRGAPDAFELDGIRRDGSLLRLQCTAKPIDWRDRRALLLTLRDITGHERAQASRSESEAQLLAIMDNAPVEIYLKDADGGYLRINRRYEELWGVTDADVRGKLPGDVHRQKDFAAACRIP